MRALSYFIVFFLGLLIGYSIGLYQAEPRDWTVIKSDNPTPRNGAVQPLVESQPHASSTGKKPSDKQPADDLLSVLAPHLIDVVPEQSVSNLLNFLIPADELEDIANIKQFAKRYLEETSLHNTPVNSDSYAHVFVSTNSQGVTSATNINIAPSDKIYAHIQFYGGIATGSQRIFSRWVNLDTDDVLFFERSYINPNQDKNWVYFSPHGGWITGNYDVSFYLFSAQLEKLGHANFYLSVQDQ